MKKTQILESFKDLPEEISLDEIIEHLLILQKIEDGRQQIIEGKYLTEEEAVKKLEKWLK